jgi:hypothetical protein
MKTTFYRVFSAGLVGVVGVLAGATLAVAATTIRAHP